MENYIKPIAEILEEEAFKKLLNIMEVNSKVLEENYHREIKKNEEDKNKALKGLYLERDTLVPRIDERHSREFPTKHRLIVSQSGTGKTSLLNYWVNQAKISNLLEQAIATPYLIDEYRLFQKFIPFDYDLDVFYRTELQYRKYIFLDDFFKKDTWTYTNNEISKKQRSGIFQFIDLLYDKMNSHIIVITSNNQPTEEIVGDFRTYRRLQDIFKDK